MIPVIVFDIFSLICLVSSLVLFMCGSYPEATYGLGMAIIMDVHVLRKKAEEKPKPKEG